MRNHDMQQWHWPVVTKKVQEETTEEVNEEINEWNDEEINEENVNIEIQVDNWKVENE